LRAFLPKYELIVPRDLGEALSLLAGEPGAWRPFAGGTDLMVLLEAGHLEHTRFFSLHRLRELRGISETDSHVAIGALTTYTDLLASETVRRHFPSLCRAARETGGIAIQNRGTLGGNIANASPAADAPPALLVYGAEIELVSREGRRVVDYAGFHTAYKRTVMRADELIAGIRLPKPKDGARHFYRKVGTRRAQAISKVCFAGLIETDGDGDGLPRVGQVRLALGSVAPTVVRCRHAEEALRGRALDVPAIEAAIYALARDISPIDDIRSSADYRARVARNLLAEFLSQAGAR
jgi:CO/xanthine dehydrogenase FAD-binding subunit